MGATVLNTEVLMNSKRHFNYYIQKKFLFGFVIFIA